MAYEGDTYEKKRSVILSVLLLNYDRIIIRTKRRKSEFVRMPYEHDTYEIIKP